MTYSSTTKFLKELEERLSDLDIPIFYKLPEASKMEPFLVIGSVTSDTGKTALTGAVIEDMTVSIDIFLPNNSRTLVEEAKFKAIRLLGRNTKVSATVMLDDSIGREVYHIAIRVTESII